MKVSKTTFFVFIAGVLAFLGLLSFYTSETTGEKICEYILENCHAKDGCTISIGDFTDFEWEVAYVFEPSMGERDISKTLDVPYGDLTYLRSYKLIFMIDGEIAKEEKIRFSGSEPEPGVLYFALKSSYIKITPQADVLRGIARSNLCMISTTNGL
jgi:hypothetical protein